MYDLNLCPLFFSHLWSGFSHFALWEHFPGRTKLSCPETGNELQIVTFTKTRLTVILYSFMNIFKKVQLSFSSTALENQSYIKHFCFIIFTSFHLVRKTSKEHWQPGLFLDPMSYRNQLITSFQFQNFFLQYFLYRMK